MNTNNERNAQEENAIFRHFLIKFIETIQNLDSHYAIDYFYRTGANVQVSGIRYASDETSTFGSEADAQDFGYNSNVTWRCAQSGSSNIHEGESCRWCN